MKTNDTNGGKFNEPIDHDDESVLRELYQDRGLTMPEVADMSEVSVSTIHNRLQSFGINRRKSGPKNDERKEGSIDHTDPEVLETKYVDEGLSLKEIASDCDVGHETIRHHLEKHGIDRRDRVEASREASREEYANLYMTGGGYEMWRDFITGRQVSVHRLLAVSEFGFDEVCGKVVHHQNKIRWDNRGDNIELMSRSEHAKHHTENGDFEIGPQ